jgi:DNA-binding NarL/FixJ family response regulator
VLLEVVNDGTSRPSRRLGGLAGLAEDQQVIRAELKALIDLHPDMQVVADVERGDQIVPAAIRQRPDVAVLDIDLPGVDGLSAIRRRCT